MQYLHPTWHQNSEICMQDNDFYVCRRCAIWEGENADLPNEPIGGLGLRIHFPELILCCFRVVVGVETVLGLCGSRGPACMPHN